MLSPASRARTCFLRSILGLAPQALCCRPLRGLARVFAFDPGAGRLRLYAVARFAGSHVFLRSILGLAPQALCCRPLRGLARVFCVRSWGWRPRLYAVARFAG